MAGAESCGHFLGFARAVQTRAVVVADRAVDARSFAHAARRGNAGNLTRAISMGWATPGSRRFRAHNSGPDRICADPSSALTVLQSFPSGFTLFVGYNRATYGFCTRCD